MPKYGFIHDKLDIKLLILYVLSRLPGPVDYSTLGDLVNNLDDGIDYFDYTECVHDLIQNGHILDDDGFYSITDKGIKNSESVESSIPYTVRMHAKTELIPFVEEMRRQGMNDLRSAVCVEDLKFNRPFITVKVVIDSGIFSHKQRCRHAVQIEIRCQIIFEDTMQKSNALLRIVNA